MTLHDTEQGAGSSKRAVLREKRRDDVLANNIDPRAAGSLRSTLIVVVTSSRMPDP